MNKPEKQVRKLDAEETIPGAFEKLAMFTRGLLERFDARFTSEISLENNSERLELAREHMILCLGCIPDLKREIAKETNPERKAQLTRQLETDLEPRSKRVKLRLRKINARIERVLQIKAAMRSSQPEETL